MSLNKDDALPKIRDEGQERGEMQRNDRDSPPSIKSNADESKLDKASLQNDIDEKEASFIEPSDLHPAEPSLAPIQPGPLEGGLALKRLDSAVPEKNDVSQDPFAHLPEHEAAILRKQLDIPEVKVGYTTLFRYASALDWVIFVIAVLASVIAGAAMPLMTVSTIDINSENDVP